MKKIILILAIALILIIFVGCVGQNKDMENQKKDEPIAKLACSSGLSEYKLENTPIQFCYDKEWGEPVVEKVAAKTGSAEKFGFGTIDNIKAPQGWIESRDFQPANGEKKIKFEFLNAMEGREDYLQKQLENAASYNPKYVKARKIDVSGVRAIRADISGNVNQIIHFIPDAFEEHHMMISAPKNMAEKVDDFVFGMVL